MDDLPPIDPEYSSAQRAEIDRIDYLLAELRTYRDRGFIAAEAVEAITSEKVAVRIEIERIGLAEGSIKAARPLINSAPRVALAHAERAKGLDPDRAEAWEIAVRSLAKLGEYDRAMEVCRDAIEGHGHSALAGQFTVLQEQRVAAGRGVAIEEATIRARIAAARDDHEAAVAASREVLALNPRHPAALQIAVAGLVALNRLDEAGACCEVLRSVSPFEAAGWVERIRTARILGTLKARSEVVWTDEIVTPAKPFVVEEPRWKWSMVAAEFLEDHWQKLILSLAVLLIVVSSTVGSAMVLGDKLWSPEGKCLLATAYTLMFAGFGRGLSKWGAERAGRIMRLTTLIVLPVNFALVGELPGLGRSSAMSLAVLAIDSAAMMALAWIVCRALDVSGGKATPGALMALGMVSALTPRSVAFAGGLGVVLAATGIFAAASEWLGRWLGSRGRAEGEAAAEAPYFAFGLLAFYYVCAIGRIGGSVLGLPPTLYSLPTMLAAFATSRVAEGLKASGHSGPSLATLRLTGHTLSALAFALALARPGPGLPLYSGNTLATALVGLALYARSLHESRAPAYLYAGFAALFLAYFGAYDFVKDFMASVEGSIGTALGYGRKLPMPFKALNGLAFNAILAGLSIGFSRLWKDDRLAWHCHLIGVPLSIAACLLSGFEPTAAVLTMGGYAMAYSAAAWLFAAPRVLYLACASLAGASFAGSTFIKDDADGSRSLAMAAVGLALWVACRAMAIGRVGNVYRVPVVHSVRVMAVVALGFAAYAVWPWGPPSWTAAAAFWVLALLYGLLGLETPIATVALGAVGCAAVAAIISATVTASRMAWPADRAWLAAFTGAVGLIYQAASPLFGRVAERRSVRLGRESRSAIYPLPLYLGGLILAAMANWLMGSHLVPRIGNPSSLDLGLAATTLALVAASLMIASAATAREEWLAHASVVAGSCALIFATLALTTSRGWPISQEILAPILGGLGLVLVAMGERVRARPTGWPGLYARPLLSATLLTVGIAWLFAGSAWGEPRVIAVTLAMTGIALALATRQSPTRPLPDLALLSGGLAWIIALDPLGMQFYSSLPVAGLLVLVYTLATLAMAEIARRFGPKGEPGVVRRVFVVALADFSALATLAALATGAIGFESGRFDVLAGVLGLAAIVSLWLTRFRNEPGLAHLGLILGWLATGSATRWAVGDSSLGDLLGWLAVVTAVDGLILCVLRAARRRIGRDPDSFRHVGIVLAAVSPLMALGAACLTLDSYPTAVVALLLAIPTLIVSARFDRSSAFVYAGTLMGVAASYLTLFAVGRGRQGHVAALGVLASGLAMIFWGLERFASQPRWKNWHTVFAIPLWNVTLMLAALAILPEWDSPGPLLLASLPFFLLLQSRRVAGWFYPALGLMVASGLFAVVHRWGFAAATPWALVSAFGCWGLGTAIRRRVGRAYDLPAYHLAIGLGAAALVLRADAIVRLGEAWTESPWIPATVAVLSLLMLGPFPGRGWVDGFAALLSLAAILGVGRWLDSPMAWGLAGVTLAVAWWFATRGIPLAGGASRFESVRTVLGQWSLGLFAAGSLPVVSRVVGEVLAATLIERGPTSPASPIEWWEGLASILLLGVLVVLTTLDRRLREPGLNATATLLVWWLAVGGSPITVRLGLDPAAMLPMVTATHALLIASARLTGRLLGSYGFGLAIVAVVLTAGRLGTATAATLILAASAQGRLAIALRRPKMAVSASLIGVIACFALGAEIARWMGWYRSPFDMTVLAASQTLAALGLVVASGWERRRGGVLARPVETVAAGSLAVAAGAGGLMVAGGCGPIGPDQAMINVGLMAAVGSLCVALAARWSSMVLAFAAQAAILLGYAAFRSGFEMKPSGDAAAILILAGIDLGVAEVAGRGRRAFALPALATGLALPIVAIALSIREGWAGPGPLFTLFAAGTFYAATCGRLRWKSLGYASAVLYNAALWALWYRFGWELAEAPPFYLVPVGFTTILFAEANRRELSRTHVNAIRGAGLTLMYLALAVPIWQTASLAAWAAVLGVSMLGIFAGIGLRSQSFLWLGLAGFLLDVIYQLGRIGMEHALAKWAIMLVLGLSLVLFVALNEKKSLLRTIRKYVDTVRGWD